MLFWQRFGYNFECLKSAHSIEIVLSVYAFTLSAANEPCAYYASTHMEILSRA